MVAGAGGKHSLYHSLFRYFKMSSASRQYDASLKAKMSKLLQEEREIMGAMAKLKELKNKLKVEELSIMAALRERSMLADTDLAANGDGTAVISTIKNDPSSPQLPSSSSSNSLPLKGTQGPDSLHKLQLSMPSTSKADFDEEEEDDDDDEDF